MSEPFREQILITVIIPAYNSEKYIKKCLLSVVYQEIPEMEILVINDGSTDRTAEIVALLVKEHKCIRLVTIENRGVSHARNVGLKRAKGRYITFVDSDDYLEPDAYKTMLEEMIRYDADIVEGACRKEKPNGTFIYNCRLHKEIVRGKAQCTEHFLKQQNCYNYMCNKIYKRDLFRNHKFPLLRYGEDYYMNALLHKEAACKLVLSRLVYHYVIHEESACGKKAEIGLIDGILTGVMTANLFKDTSLRGFPCIYTCKLWIDVAWRIYLQNDKKVFRQYIKLSKKYYRSMLVHLPYQVWREKGSCYSYFTYLVFAIFPTCGVQLLERNKLKGRRRQACVGG